MTNDQEMARIIDVLGALSPIEAKAYYDGYLAGMLFVNSLYSGIFKKREPVEVA